MDVEQLATEMRRGFDDLKAHVRAAEERGAAEHSQLRTDVAQLRGDVWKGLSQEAEKRELGDKELSRSVEEARRRVAWLWGTVVVLSGAFVVVLGVGAAL